MIQTQTLNKWIVSQSTAGTVKGVYYYGEPGIGKSTLLQMIQHDMSDKNISIVSFDFAAWNSLPNLEGFIISVIELLGIFFFPISTAEYQKQNLEVRETVNLFKVFTEEFNNYTTHNKKVAMFFDSYEIVADTEFGIWFLQYFTKSMLGSIVVIAGRDLVPQLPEFISQSKLEGFKSKECKELLDLVAKKRPNDHELTVIIERTRGNPRLLKEIALIAQEIPYAEIDWDIFLSQRDELQSKRNLYSTFQDKNLFDSKFGSKQEANDYWASINKLMGDGIMSNKSEFILLEGLSHEIEPKLTAKYIAEIIIPYISAIEKMQITINKVQNKREKQVVIKRISQESPVSVSLDGAVDAINFITETIVPWRKKHAETMANLLELEKLAEIESKKAEILQKRATAQRERTEAARIMQEIEEKKLENEKIRLQLYKERVKIAIELLSQISGNMSEEQRIAFIIEMLPPIETLTNSRLDLKK